MSIKTNRIIYTDFYESIGIPSELGFGVGVPPYGEWNTDLQPLAGTYIKGHPEWGNFVHPSTESVMVYIPPFWVAMNPNWSNGEPLYLVKDFSAYSSEAEALEDGYYMPRGFFNADEICGVYIDKYLVSKK